MSVKFTKVFAAFSFMVATFSVSASDSLQGIPGTYKLVGVNQSELPAVSWIGPDEDCKQETLGGTLLVGSENRWAALVEEREFCAETSEESSTMMEGASIFTGTYKVSGNIIEFHNEELGGTDHGSLENDVLQYTVNGILDYKGQTTVFVFVRNK